MSIFSSKNDKIDTVYAERKVAQLLSRTLKEVAPAICEAHVSRLIPNAMAKSLDGVLTEANRTQYRLFIVLLAHNVSPDRAAEVAFR